MADNTTVTLRGYLNPRRLGLALLALVVTTGIILFTVWSGMTSPVLAAFALLGYPYALFQLISTLRHAVQKVLVDDEGIRRGKNYLPWTGVQTVEKHSKEYRNRLGMKFLRTQLVLKVTDKPEWCFEDRWFTAGNFARLEQEIAGRHEIKADFTVVPPP